MSASVSCPAVRGQITRHWQIQDSPLDKSTHCSQDKSTSSSQSQSQSSWASIVPLNLVSQFGWVIPRISQHGRKKLHLKLSAYKWTCKKYNSSHFHLSKAAIIGRLLGYFGHIWGLSNNQLFRETRKWWTGSVWQHKTGSVWQRKTGSVWQHKTGSVWQQKTGSVWQQKTGSVWQHKTRSVWQHKTKPIWQCSMG